MMAQDFVLLGYFMDVLSKEESLPLKFYVGK